MSSWRAFIAVILLTPGVLVVSGCVNARLPAIDPSGQRIFLPRGNYTTFSNDNAVGRLFGHRRGDSVTSGLVPSPPSTTPGPYEPALLNRPRQRLSSLFHRQQQVQGPGQNRGTPAFSNEPAFTSAAVPPLCGPDGFAPDGAPCYPIGSPTQSSLDATLPGAPALGTPATGVRIPSRQALSPGVVIDPSRLVAAIGEEVVVVGAVRSPSGVFRTGEPVQWSLSQDSAGTIVDAAAAPTTTRRLFGFLGRRNQQGRPQGCGNCVSSETSTRCNRLTRNPLDPSDDISLSRGQTWVSLTSGSEGVSYVTLAAPRLENWGRRQQTATVIWVDGQWLFPAPQIRSPADDVPLTTQVVRQSDGQPIAGWIVRYTYLDGPEVFINNQDVTGLDVPTDAQGRATAIVKLKGAGQNTTRIRTQVIKLQTESGQPPQLLLGESISFVTWSDSEPTRPIDIPLASPTPAPPPTAPPPLGEAPDIPPIIPDAGSVDGPIASDGPIAPTPQPRANLELDVRGPLTAKTNQQLTYEVTVRNTGNAAARDVVVTLQPPLGAQYLGSEPREIGRNPQRIDWRLPTRELAPGATGRIQVGILWTDGGRQQISFFANGTNTEDASGSQVTEVAPESLQLTVSDPSPFQVQVGDVVSFDILVTNTGSRSIDVTLEDLFDPGLEELVTGTNVDANTGIKIPAFPVPPGSERRTIRFRALTPGRQTHRVRVTGSDGSVAEAGGSVMVVQGPSVRLDVSGPTQIRAGTTELYQITLQNTGPTTLTNVRLFYGFKDEDLIARNVTDGFEATTDPRVLSWSVQPMAPDTAVTVTVELEANPQPLKQRARNTVVVTADGGLEESRAIDVDILPPVGPPPGNVPPGTAGGGADGIGQVRTGTLLSSIKSLTVTPQVGEPIEYVITVSNNSSQPHRNVQVTVQLDENMSFSGPARGPGGVRPIQNVNGVLLFSPLAFLRPDETVTYQVSATSNVAGEVIVSARVDADDASLRIRELVDVAAR